MTKQYRLDYESPIGVIEIVGTGEAIYSILFLDRKLPINRMTDQIPKVLKDCYWQLDEYFKGTRYEFTFPYIHEGTMFQQHVWNALTNISYGQTSSYKELAVSIGKEEAVRAVGNANGKNKLSIVIPCHRIIGSNGKLTGYAGGLWRKEWLLQHEQVMQKKHTNQRI